MRGEPIRIRHVPWRGPWFDPHEEDEVDMQTLSLLWGGLACLFGVVAFIPFLGFLNWLVIPFAGVGFLISIVALATAKKDESKVGSILGVVLCGAVTGFGVLRLFLGGGVL
jgi:hypothetical protein